MSGFVFVSKTILTYNNIVPKYQIFPFVISTNVLINFFFASPNSISFAKFELVNKPVILTRFCFIIITVVIVFVGTNL